MNERKNLRIGDTVRVVSVYDEDVESGISIGDRFTVQKGFPEYILIRQTGNFSFYPLYNSQIELVGTKKEFIPIEEEEE